MADDFPDRERFMRWWFSSGQFECRRNRIENAKMAWVEALKREKRFSCHADYFDPAKCCVLDGGRLSDCDCAVDLATNGKTKADCEYWREE